MEKLNENIGESAHRNFSESAARDDYMRAVKAHIKNGYHKSAYGLLQQAMVRYPDDVRLLSYYGWLQVLVDKQYESGIETCKRAIVLHKSSASLVKKALSAILYLNLGRAYLAAGMKKDAIDVFTIGLKYDNRNSELLYELEGLGTRKKEFLFFLDRSNRINKFLGLILRKSHKASTPASQDNHHLDLAPEDMHCRMAERDRLENPGNDPYDTREAAAALSLEGMKQFKMRNFWGADEALQRAMQLDPNNAEYVFHRGLNLSHIPRRGHEAEEYFVKAIEMEPARTGYSVALAKFYLRTGQKGRALSQYEDALKHDASTAKEIRKAYFSLAKRFDPAWSFDPETIVKQEKFEEFFHRIHEAYETCSSSASGDNHHLDLAPEDIHSRMVERDRLKNSNDVHHDTREAATALFRGGMKQFNGKNFWGADEAFQGAMRLDPKNAEYVFHRGLNLSYMPRRGCEAEEYLVKAIEMAPKKMEYYAALGEYYLRRGDKDLALALFQDALKHDPKSMKIKRAIKKAGA